MEKTITFAKRLKELRLGQKQTQADLAKCLSVTQQAVGLWETGKAEPPSATIRRLARIFDVTADDLLGLDDGKYAKLEKRITRLEKLVAGMREDGVRRCAQ